MNPRTSQQPRVAFVTLGCPKNEVDTDQMLRAVLGAGLSVTDDPADADVVVINTCSFIQEATEESLATFFEVLSSPPAGPAPRVIIAGCMPSRYGDELAEALPEAAALVPVSEESRIVDVIAQVTGIQMDTEPPRSIPRCAPGPSAYLRISDGCHRSCAYCTIPSIRGPYTSRPMRDIVAEAKALVATGAKELVLVGQDTTAWGRGLDEAADLADLLEELAAVPGLAWIRLMYAQPDGVASRLLSTMAALPQVCHYLDMPLQHASARVLRRMRRRGDKTHYLRLLTLIRTHMPDAVLRTTLIAGFPGESRADAALLEDFVAEAGFDYTGVFVYSPEDGTDAATMPGQVPLRTRRARAQRLRDIADKTGFARAEALIGSELDVLVEGTDPDDGRIIGRWRGQAPDIDGVVTLDRGSRGDIVVARVVDAFGYDLEAEVI